MMMQIEDKTVSDDLRNGYQELADFLRLKIHDLRPPMLNYGLHAAFRELVDELKDREKGKPEIFMEIPSNSFRYEAQLEEHCYRIIQQAIENALKHAQAQKLRLSGQMEKDSLSLTVEDDGKGFDLSEGLNLVALLEEQHFGLAGMSERANLIGAQIKLESVPGQGSKISLAWQRMRE